MVWPIIAGKPSLATHVRPCSEASQCDGGCTLQRKTSTPRPHHVHFSERRARRAGMFACSRNRVLRSQALRARASGGDGERGPEWRAIGRVSHVPAAQQVPRESPSTPMKSTDSSRHIYRLDPIKSPLFANALGQIQAKSTAVSLPDRQRVWRRLQAPTEQRSDHARRFSGSSRVVRRT